ncbi:hypothetical protein CDV31_015945 [Fusarium ambrosium]|uniref:NAD-dependent epimerase/dehydratase domain-containing protein n=1 Tax=Fusarium ambrosium TaxID=131363 RepID=A0A428SH52_9HYPO|nr:hypothetical protein CDV31_015945 [Fusarium ambrosium]
MAVPKILLVGATGFIALVREKSQADVLAAQGLQSILFKSLDDLDLLERVARDYDIVVRCADGFHRSSGEALIKGLGQRQMETGKMTYFIRTSGVSGIADRPISGRYIETCELSDKDSIYAYEQHRETMEGYPSRQADIAIVDAGERANVNTYIIMSPLIYGRGNGLFNTRSMQIPSIIRSAREWGYVGYVGNALYELLLAKIVSGVEIPSGKAGIFFSAAGRHSWRALANSIATAGVKLGLLRSDEAKEISIEQAAAAWTHGMFDFVEPGFGSRATTRADLAKELGWEPKKTDTDWQGTFLDEWES